MYFQYLKELLLYSYLKLSLTILVLWILRRNRITCENIVRCDGCTSLLPYISDALNCILVLCKILGKV